MAALAGITTRAAYVNGSPGRVANPGAAEPASTPMTPAGDVPAIIDGTPVRVAVLALSAAGGLMALRLAGFRFNVGVSAR